MSGCSAPPIVPDRRARVDPPLYFLLAAGDLFLQKLIKVLPLLRDKKKAVAIARETEASISTYLFTVAMVNLVLGLVITLVMPSSACRTRSCGARWRQMAEFIPVIGADGPCWALC